MKGQLGGGGGGAAPEVSVLTSSWIMSVAIRSRSTFMERVWLGAEIGVGVIDAFKLLREG